MSAPVSPDLKNDVDQVLEAIIYLYTESRRVTKELARRADLTGPQLTVVKMLEQIGELSLSELSERIRAQNSTVTGIIDRMEREGLVVRERSKEDRRVVYIRLTPKGKKLAEDVPIETWQIFRDALDSLSQAEVKDLVKILGKLARRVRQSVAATPGAGPTGERQREGEPR
jgi:DNA-binding MarR family transcriptional regulator